MVFFKRKFIKTTVLSGFRPVVAHVKMNRGELKNPVWTGDPKVSGGFLYETPIHLFDMIRWQMGDVLVALVFGFVGYGMKKFGFSRANLVIGLVMGAMVGFTVMMILDVALG